MGIIKRQGIKNSLVNYFGVAIGAFNVIVVYPWAVETTEAYGLMRFLIDTSLLMMPFILLGSNALAIRFFPNFKDENKGDNGFLVNLLLLFLLGTVLFTVLFYLFQDQITGFYGDKKWLKRFIFFLVPLTILSALISLLSQYISNFHRIVVPSVLNILIKISLPVLIFLYFLKVIKIEGVVYGVLANFAVVAIGLLLYLRHLGQLNLRPDFDFVGKSLFKEMRVYAAFGIFGLLGTYLGTRIDSFMIGTMLGEFDTGMYGIMLFIAGVIEIPTMAIIKITSPIVSEAWKKNDLGHIKELYQKTSINLLVFGSLLFIGIYSNLDSLFDLMPRGHEFRPFKHIVLFIGFAKLIDMATSINTQIIGYSKYFRFNFYAILFLAGFNVVANLLAIPAYHIVGAAMATLASISLYNLVKFVFILNKFKMQPLSLKTVWVVLIALGVYFISSIIPSTHSAILDIILRSAVITVLFGGTVFYLKISEDINQLATDFLKKVRFL